jgi:hypothetical protein
MSAPGTRLPAPSPSVYLMNDKGGS